MWFSSRLGYQGLTTILRDLRGTFAPTPTQRSIARSPGSARRRGR